VPLAVMLMLLSSVLMQLLAGLNRVKSLGHPSPPAPG
jgi:hypothetical protein